MTATTITILAGRAAEARDRVKKMEKKVGDRLPCSSSKT